MNPYMSGSDSVPKKINCKIISIGSAASFFFGVILFKLLATGGCRTPVANHVVQILVDVGHDPAPTLSAVERR